MLLLVRLNIRFFFLLYLSALFKNQTKFSVEEDMGKIYCPHAPIIANAVYDNIARNKSGKITMILEVSCTEVDCYR